MAEFVSNDSSDDSRNFLSCDTSNQGFAPIPIVDGLTGSEAFGKRGHSGKNSSKGTCKSRSKDKNVSKEAIGRVIVDAGTNSILKDSAAESMSDSQIATEDARGKNDGCNTSPGWQNLGSKSKGIRSNRNKGTLANDDDGIAAMVATEFAGEIAKEADDRNSVICEPEGMQNKDDKEGLKSCPICILDNPMNALRCEIAALRLQMEALILLVQHDQKVCESELGMGDENLLQKQAEGLIVIKDGKEAGDEEEEEDDYFGL